MVIIVNGENKTFYLFNLRNKLTHLTLNIVTEKDKVGDAAGEEIHKKFL